MSVSERPAGWTHQPGVPYRPKPASSVTDARPPPGFRMMTRSRPTFRITLWRPWLLAVTPFALLAALGIAVGVATGDLAATPGYLIALAGLALALLVPVGLAVWVSRWHVDPNGVGGRNNWLVYRSLDWSEIDSVEPWLIPGYPYLQVNGGGMRWAFWLPLFLTDMPGFLSAVARYAPPDNPLRRYLERHSAGRGAAAGRSRK
jgi:hypothetical protein